MQAEAAVTTPAGHAAGVIATATMPCDEPGDAVYNRNGSTNRDHRHQSQYHVLADRRKRRSAGQTQAIANGGQTAEDSSYERTPWRWEHAPIEDAPDPRLVRQSLHG